MSFYRRAVLAPLFALAASMAFSQTVEFAPREVLVKFRGSPLVAANYALIANRAIGAQTIRLIERINVDRVKIPVGMPINDAVSYYGSLNTVEYAEPNVKMTKQYTPNDPRFGGQYGPQKTKCPEAWGISKGKPTTIIAIIDDGIAATHEDLDSKKVAGYDFSDGDSDPTTTEDHGSHCAGIAAGATDNAKGIAGAGFNCKFMPLKIFPNATAANSAEAMIYAADHGAKVISMSYGAFFESITERNAVNYAWGKGVVLLGAAGNAGVTNKFYPAAHTNCVAVGSTNQTDQRSGFSNYGQDWVDVGAPGEAIDSTVNGGYALFDGTSMSCPLAAGVTGLLWSFAQPGTTAAQIRFALENNTDPVGGGGFKFGRVNAFKAIQTLDPGTADLSNATAVSLWTGAGFSGGPGDLGATDGSFVAVTTSLSPLGQLGGVVVDFAFTVSPTNLREANAFIESNGPAGSTGQLYLWDYVSSKFVLIKAFALQATGVKRERLILPLNLSRYVSGGNLRAGIRAIGPNRSPGTWKGGPFDFKIGFARISTRPNL